MVFHKLNPIVFGLAFSLGMLLTYISVPAPEVIVRFPSPENSGKIIYKHDTNDTCYKYRAKKVDCANYKGRVKEQPVEL